MFKRGRLGKIKSSGDAVMDHETLLALINSMTDGVLAVDGQGKVVLNNGGAMNILDTNQLQGRQLGEVLNIVDKNSRPIDLEKLLQQSTVAITNSSWRLRYSDGSFSNLYISASPIRSGYMSKVEEGHVIFLRDITREKSLEGEREEFISVASHELRTPIAIAEGNISNVQLLTKNSNLDESIKQSLQEAHQQIVFLSSLINDLSMLSRAERGKLTLEIEEIDVHALITELVHEYTPQAASKGLQLSSAVGESVNSINTSELYVKEILQNFITNAIKYTEAGSVQLLVTAEPGFTKFSVRDTGMGIAQAEQHKLFSKFFRSSDNRVQKITGTGLGLYVSSKLAHLLGGKIEVQTNLDKGSTFTLCVPANHTVQGVDPEVDFRVSSSLHNNIIRY